MSLMRLIDPLERRLAVIASPSHPRTITWVGPLCLEAVRRAALSGYELSTGHDPGLGALAADEAARAGSPVTIALPHEEPPDHWSFLLRAVHGRAIHVVRADIHPKLEWASMARLHYRGAPPVPISHLAAAHAAIDQAESVLLLPALGAFDPIADHIRWLCRLLDIPLFDLSTISGLASLRQALGESTAP